MSDKGFDFQPPPPRRPPRQFEPPPWEKDQFEQLARERAEQERAQREAALAAQAAAQAEADETASRQSASEDAGSGEQGEQSASPGSGSAAAVESAPTAVKEQSSAEPRVELDERQVELLLLGLREEEPQPLAGMWLVGLVAGVVVVLVGIAIGVWGTAAMFNAALGSTGKFGGTVLVVFGLAFVGVGGWLVYRALRQRGVL